MGKQGGGVLPTVPLLRLIVGPSLLLLGVLMRISALDELERLPSPHKVRNKPGAAAAVEGMRKGW